MVWDQENYLAEADMQLYDNETSGSSNFKDKDLVKLVEKSKSIFQSLKKEEPLSISFINVRRPSISQKCTYYPRSISI